VTSCATYPSIIIAHPRKGTAILHSPLEAWNLMREWSDTQYKAKAYLKGSDSFEYKSDRWVSFLDYLNGR
jgi:hypothetical protein